MSDDYKSRLKAELEELKERVSKLDYFITESEKFSELDDVNRTLLICQRDAMIAYENILSMRVNGIPIEFIE